jgi:excisionase family DNA binding protein
VSVSTSQPFSERASLLTAEQLAERWQVTPQHVYRLAREGRIPCVRIGRYQRFREAAIGAWELAQEQAADG